MGHPSRQCAEYVVAIFLLPPLSGPVSLAWSECIHRYRREEMRLGNCESEREREAIYRETHTQGLGEALRKDAAGTMSQNTLTVAFVRLHPLIPIVPVRTHRSFVPHDTCCYVRSKYITKAKVLSHLSLSLSLSLSPLSLSTTGDQHTFQYAQRIRQ